MRTGIVTLSLALAALWAGACSSSSGGTGGSNPAGSSGGLDDSGGGSSSGAGGSSGTSSGNTSSSGASTSSGAGSSGTSSGGSSGGGDAAASSSGGGDAAALGPYPSGPYCTAAPASPPAAFTDNHLAVGCVLPNITWVGYNNPNGASIVIDGGMANGVYGTYTLDQARMSGKRYAMINLAERSCPGCQNSAMNLESGGAAVEQAGGLVIELLETSGFSFIASRTDLDYWVNNYMLKVTAVKDPDSSTGTPSLTFFGHRDQAYIVDLSTMKIVQYINGSIGSLAPNPNSAGLAMQQMDILLGVADH